MDSDYALAFSLADGVGPKSFCLLLKNFDSARKAWNATEEELLPILRPAKTAKLIKFRKYFDLEKYKSQLKKQKISVVGLTSDLYPKLLREIADPPIVLYCKGDLDLLSKDKIAIVGTRHITSYGKQITEMFASELANSNLVIVSGMALGVDAVAHESTLGVSGKTIAVLGNGVDTPYPAENEKLYEEILDNGGLIVSEYPPGKPASIGSFPARNRIVAGMSLRILVTEGASDSGSLITANFGLDFGRKVFAVPGPITSPLSKAPLDLIAKGAKLVTSPGDILKELGIKTLASKKKEIKGETKQENLVLNILENESLGFDEIARKTKMETSKLAILLSLMEIKGFIKSDGARYQLV